MGGFSVLGIAFIVLGLAGFSKRGLPLSKKKRITGPPARWAGALCTAIGIGLVVAAYALSDPAQRDRLFMFYSGIVLGSGCTILALRYHWP